MADNVPILDYARSPQRGFVPWQVIAAVPLLWFVPMTMCMCGHLDWFALPFTAGAASLSWWGFARKSRPGVWRAIVMVVVVLATAALVKNGADLLWFGHDPLLRSSPR